MLIRETENHLEGQIRHEWNERLLHFLLKDDMHLPQLLGLQESILHMDYAYQNNKRSSFRTFALRTMQLEYEENLFRTCR